VARIPCDPSGILNASIIEETKKGERAPQFDFPGKISTIKQQVWDLWGGILFQNQKIDVKVNN